MVHEKAFDVTYTVLNDDGQYDVSFELSEEAEDTLFTGLAQRVHDDATDGIFDGETVHLYKKLAEQRESHPPWFEVDHKRTYDLEMTPSEYNTLTTIIGQQLQNVLRPSGADRYRELLDVWEDITDAMLWADEIDDYIEQSHDGRVQATINDSWGSIPDPDNGTFMCFIHDNTIAVYENERTGNTWHYCRSCGLSKPSIGGDHECL